MAQCGIIVLCRLDSSRLPNKAMFHLPNGQLVIEYILRRLNRTCFPVVLATSDQASDEPLRDWAKSNGFSYFQGSKVNVANRFVECAEQSNFDYAVRINGDNVFSDPTLVTNLATLAKANRYDFVSNVEGRTFPQGMSVEVIKTKFFSAILSQIVTAGHREHVTSWFYDNPRIGSRFYFQNQTDNDLSCIDLALDTYQDFVKISEIVEHCETNSLNPELANISEWLRV